MESLPDGLYVAVLNEPSDDNAILNPTYLPPPAGKPFWVGDNEPDDLLTATGQAQSEQDAFRKTEVRQHGYVGPERLALHVILDRCLLDYHQIVEGGRLSPLPIRLGSKGIVEVINTLRPDDIRFNNIFEINDTYSLEHPLALATFLNVAAESVGTAITAVQPRLGRILGALTLDRSATPTPLANLSKRPDGQFSLSLPQATYTGNLISGFDPGGYSAP